MGGPPNPLRPPFLPPLQCPWCAYGFLASDGASEADRPHPGAASLCYQCGRLGVFTDQGAGRLGLRRASAAEAAKIAAQPEMRVMLATLRRDPLRAMPGGPAVVVARWRDRVLLDQLLPRLRGEDPGTQ
jgi:hypothetical protein